MKKKTKTEVQLTYDISGVQESDSVKYVCVYTNIYVFFFIFLSIIRYYKILNIVTLFPLLYIRSLSFTYFIYSSILKMIKLVRLGPHHSKRKSFPKIKKISKQVKENGDWLAENLPYSRQISPGDSFGMIYYAEFYNRKHSKCETGSSAPKHLLMRKILTPQSK